MANAPGVPYVPNEEVYAGITKLALEGFDKGLDPIQIMETAWDAMPDFPMHCPEHHYLTAAALLAAYRRLNGDEKQQLDHDLAIALGRARNVLGGFCGFYGACGAAIGAGIFLSVFTNTTPYSTDTWQDTTGITAFCLQRISDLGGPRCCKRVCYTAANAAAEYMREHFQLDAKLPDELKCHRHDRNKECIKEQCPYYEK